MNAEQRLNLISKIAQNDHYFTDGDEYWLIGMLSDTTMSDDALMQQIEVVKTRLPKYAQFLECSKISSDLNYKTHCVRRNSLHWWFFS